VRRHAAKLRTVTVAGCRLPVQRLRTLPTVALRGGCTGSGSGSGGSGGSAHSPPPPLPAPAAAACTSRGALVAAALLACNATLASLDLGGNGAAFGPLGAARMAVCVAASRTLRTLRCPPTCPIIYDCSLA
jgi:hypothetical protein